MSATLQTHERIDLRTTSEVKALIARAAATSGLSLSAFLLGAAQERAQEVLAESESLSLTPSDWEAFFSALDQADKPRPRLEAAARDYVKWRESRQS
jgi:uncharacterized protein (DUF1778 family)